MSYSQPRGSQLSRVDTTNALHCGFKAGEKEDAMPITMTYNKLQGWAQCSEPSLTGDCIIWFSNGAEKSGFFFTCSKFEPTIKSNSTCSETITGNINITPNSR